MSTGRFVWMTNYAWIGLGAIGLVCTASTLHRCAS